MESNKKIKSIGAVIASIIILFLLAAVGLVYKITILDSKPTTSNPSSTVILKEDKYKQVTSPKNYGTPVSTSEEGFGRENPFVGY